MRAARILAALMASLVIVASVPTFLAFESHMVGVTARVVQPAPPIEKLRSGPDPAPVGTYQEWFFTIVVTNTFATPMENVVVTDHFGAELEAEVVSSTAALPELEVFGNQARLTWSLGLLDVGHSETLVLRVSTRANPAGHQEYTSPGVYEQNSGATIKWNGNPTGQRFSASTERIYVTIVDPDVDGDGVPASVDCNDGDPAVHQGSTEIPYDGVDQDCDGQDLIDVDGDGHAIGSDCDDNDSRIYPGAVEVIGDGLDEDCDPTTPDGPGPTPTPVPESPTPSITPEPDADGDGYGVGSDCDDNDSRIHPGAVEVIGDGLDEDCDPTTPDGPGLTPTPVPESPTLQPEATPSAITPEAEMTRTPPPEPTPTGTSGVEATATPEPTAMPEAKLTATPTATYESGVP